MVYIARNFAAQFLSLFCKPTAQTKASSVGQKYSRRFCLCKIIIQRNDTDVDIHKQHLQLSICHVHSRSRIFRTVWSSTESHLCPLTVKLQIIGVNNLLNVSSSLYQRKISLCKLLLHIVLQINCPGHYVP